MACIYVLRNKVNGKIYVGQTIQSFYKRFRNHFYVDSYICRALKKYGKDNFEKFIFYVPVELLDFFEKELIEKLNCLDPFGYNLTSGGNEGKIYSEQTKFKLRISHLGIEPPNKGKPMAPELREKMAEIRRNQPKYKGSGLSKQERYKIWYRNNPEKMKAKRQKAKIWKQRTEVKARKAEQDKKYREKNYEKLKIKAREKYLEKKNRRVA